MEPKVAMVFALFGVIIALSHLDDDRIATLKRQFAALKLPMRRLLPTKHASMFGLKFKH